MPYSILAETPSDDGPSRAGPWRAVWLCLGLVCVAVGVVGVFVPLLPTTGPLILALACFARSSPRLETWLLNHPRFGPSLRAWRGQGAVPRVAKIAACLGMALGYGLFWLAVQPGWMVGAAVALALVLCAVWIISRPTPIPEGSSDGL